VSQEGILLAITCTNPVDYFCAKFNYLDLQGLEQLPEDNFIGTATIMHPQQHRIDIPLVIINKKEADQPTAHEEKKGGETSTLKDIIGEHESQHFLNTLFVPPEIKLTWLEELAQYSGKEATSEVMTNLVESMALRARRQLGLDERARDEILATYVGAAPADLPNIKDLVSELTQSPKYDVIALNRKLYGQLPERITKFINKYGEFVFYHQADKDTESEPVKSEPINVRPKKAKRHLDLVFQEKFKADLERWTDAILELEHKGYSKTEIGGLLYQSPIHEWPGVARRATSRKSKKE
jgi:hypothetical protein